MLGEPSPLGRLYDLDADVLLLGADHDCNTSPHLAEYRQPAPPGSATARRSTSRWTGWPGTEETEER